MKEEEEVEEEGQQGKPKRRKILNRAVSSLSWSRDSRHLLSGQYDGHVCLWSLCSSSSSHEGEKTSHHPVVRKLKMSDPVIAVQLHPGFTWKRVGDSPTTAIVLLLTGMCYALLCIGRNDKRRR